MSIRTPFTIYGRQFSKSNLAVFDSSTGTGVWNVPIPQTDKDEFRYFNVIKIFNGTNEGGGETDVDLCFGDYNSTQKWRIPARHLLILEGLHFLQPYIVNSSTTTTNSSIICEVEKIPLSHRGIKRALIPLTEFEPKIVMVSPEKITPTGGVVLWSENFKDNVNRFDAGTLDNTAPKVRSGGYALKLTSAGADPWTTTANCFTVGSHKNIFNSKIASNISIQSQSSTNAAGGLNSIDFENHFSNAVTLYKWGIRILLGATDTAAKLQYLDSNAAWQDITGGTFTIQSGIYYNFQLFVNTVTKKYEKLIFGSQEFDLSSYSLCTLANARNYGKIQLKVVGVNSTTKSAWFDDLQISYNEK